MKKRKLRKSIKFVMSLLLVLLATVGYLAYGHYADKRQKLLNAEIVSNITSHYNKYVKVIQNTKLYQFKDNIYQEYGIVYKDCELSLNDVNIVVSTVYFYIPSLELYISYQDVMPIDALSINDVRYKNYIVFNKNVVTNDDFTLYKDGKEVYTFYNSMSFPIIINNYDDQYYVSFDDKLFALKVDDVKEIIDSDNTSINNRSYVTTLCYHRIYDVGEKCTDKYICQKKSSFDEEMQYLSDNNYLTLTMEEMYLYISGKIQVPNNTVMLTFDDGYLFENAIDVLEKYHLNGSGFIITGRFDNLDYLMSPNFELHSHTDSLHTASVCPKENSNQQGGGILCLNRDLVLKDLKASRDKLNNPIGLAYPFYDYNNRAIALLKEAGFKIAFIGANGVNGKGKPGINLYMVPRKTIYDTTSFASWKSYL